MTTQPGPFTGDGLPPTLSRITQSERSAWQRRAAFAGRVSSLAPGHNARDAFTRWQAALRLDTVREEPNPSAGMTRLFGKGRHGVTLNVPVVELARRQGVARSMTSPPGPLRLR